MPETPTAPATGAPAEPAAGRRTFARALVTGVAAVAGLLSGVPVLGALLDPITNPRTGARIFRRVARASAVPPDRPVALPVIGDRVDAWVREPRQKLGTVWLQRAGDTFVCHSGECPHLGCQIRFDAGKREFECPCHASSFGLDGAVLSGPSPRPLDTLEVRVAGDDVEVRFARFRPQASEKEEV